MGHIGQFDEDAGEGDLVRMHLKGSRPGSSKEKDDDYGGIGGPFRNSYDREISEERQRREEEAERQRRKDEEDSWDHGIMHREY